MICKDCIHFNTCDAQKVLYRTRARVPCMHFEDKNLIQRFVENVKQYINLEHLENPDEKVFSERDVILIVEKIAREME